MLYSRLTRGVTAISYFPDNILYISIISPFLSYLLSYPVHRCYHVIIDLSLWITHRCYFRLHGLMAVYRTSYRLLNGFCLAFSARCVRNESSRYCHDVHPSVCLSGTGVHCDYTVYFSADLSVGYMVGYSPMFWTPVTLTPKHVQLLPAVFFQCHLEESWGMDVQTRCYISRTVKDRG